MKTTELQALLNPTVQQLKFEIWGIEYLPYGKHALLRIYIDSPNGITVDDCALVSEHVSALLDVEDAIKQHYTLEVSSPGIDRPLFTPDQYLRYIDQLVSITTRLAVGGRRKFKGILTAVDEVKVVLDVDKNLVEIQQDNISKSNVCA